MAHGMTTRKLEPMTQARTETVMREYLVALLGAGPFANYFADDIVVSFMDAGQEIAGRETASQMITSFHQESFTSVLEVKSFIAGAGIAYAEIDFAGTHSGDFFGIPATGAEVRVPYVAVWDLAGDKITAIRLYGPVSGLLAVLNSPAPPES